MPAAIVAVAATVGAEYVGALFAEKAFEFTVGLAAKAAFSAAVSLVSESLSRTDAPQNQSPVSTDATARKQLIRSSVEPRRAIYGEAQTSGALMYASNGSDANYVHLVIAVAGHACQAINNTYFGTEVAGDLDADGNVTTGRFAGYVRIRKYLGSETQAGDPDLGIECPEWGAKARPGKGITWVYLRIKRSQDVWPTGLPTPKFDVLGKNDILDVRTGLTGYTNNAALVSLDYILWKRGFNSALDEVNQSTWITAANVCDEVVSVPGGGTQKRYTINGSFTLDAQRAEILDEMRGAMAGAALYSMGVWEGYAGAASSPVIDLSEKHLRGPYKVHPRAADDQVYNAVKGTYVETTQWTETDFPAITNPLYEAQDGGERIYKDVKLPFTIDPYMAQRIVKIDLERHRQPVVVEYPARLIGQKVKVWEVVRLSIAKQGWVNKQFRVVDKKISLFGGADLVLEEYSPTIYTMLVSEMVTVDPAPDTTLASPSFVRPPGAPMAVESLYQTSGSAGVKSRVTLTWPASPDGSALECQAEYQAEGESSWTAMPRVFGTQAIFNDIAPGRYLFRAKAINALGVSSSYSTSAVTEVFGLLAAPADVTGLSVHAMAGLAYLTWDLDPDLDVRIGGRIVVRWSPKTSGASWNDGIVLDEFNGDAVAAVTSLMTGTYMAKARDSSGGYSTNAAAFVATESVVTGWSTVGTSVQHPAFAGAKASTAAVDSLLKLDGSTLVDSMPGNIDSLGVWDSIGGVNPIGTYDFADTMDLGTVAGRRYSAAIQALSVDTGDYWDARSGTIDSWGLADGGVIDDCDATLLIRTTNDDPAGSPAWSAWTQFFVADFTCRAAQFRLQLTSGNSTHNIQVSALSVTAKIPV